MKRYSIKIINVEAKIHLIKVLRKLEPDLTLIEAKGLVWEEKVVDFSKIRRDRHPARNYTDDFVFTAEEFAYVNRELDNLVDFKIDRKEEAKFPLPSIEEAFRAGFEAGGAESRFDSAEEAWAKFRSSF